MDNLLYNIELLENKVSKVLHKYERLKLKLQESEAENAELRAVFKAQKQRLNQVFAENKRLQSVSGLLGSDEFKHETKTKINRLVKEIDDCILALTR